MDSGASLFNGSIPFLKVITMDFEDRLKKLQSLFTHALSHSVTAKARYLAIAEGRNATPRAIALAKMHWQQFEARKIAIIAQMVALEEMEIETV